jgi:Protein of unknown function (DUF3016)
MQLPTRILSSLLFAASFGAASAGTVNVSYTAFPEYAPLGSRSWDESLVVLGNHLQKLGKRMLPADQVLTIEVLQLDLAGTVRGSQVRVLSGGADWPRMVVRYTLEAPGRPDVVAEERVADMNYLRSGMTAYGDSEPLFYEKRMLTRWFRERFAAAPG